MRSNSEVFTYGSAGRKGLEVSILDIDVSLHDMVYQRYASAVNFLGRQRPATVEDYAIEGAVSAPLSVDEAETFLVYISGFEPDSIDQIELDRDPDRRSPCFISTDRQSEYSWCTNVFIQGAVFRRLVELYASRRIDSVRLTIKLHVLRGPTDKLELPSVTFPMLGPSGALSLQHVRCQLMSVYTSLRADPAHGSEILPPQQTWGSRLGRRSGG
jgi:hypothetical protein